MRQKLSERYIFCNINFFSEIQEFNLIFLLFYSIIFFSNFIEEIRSLMLVHIVLKKYDFMFEMHFFQVGDRVVIKCWDKLEFAIPQ